MFQIKIYNKNFEPLTTFSEGEFVDLEYRHSLNEIGDCSFILDINNQKVNDENMRHYNRIEVLDNGVVRWIGYIARKEIDFNTIKVRCLELIGILKKFVVGYNYTFWTVAGDAVEGLLNLANSKDNTGILFGEKDVDTILKMTFDMTDIFSVIKKIADATVAQFEVDENRKLNFKVKIGKDLSDSVIFRYNFKQIIQSNILKFEVEDDGSDIFSKAYGKSETLNISKTNDDLKNKYGLLETFKNFRVADDIETLEKLTENEIRDAFFSPRLDLLPNVLDNFKVGDIVRMQILNKLIDIDDKYQIIEKKVKLKNKQKLFSVRISNLSQDIVNKIRDFELRLSLLENKL